MGGASAGGERRRHRLPADLRAFLRWSDGGAAWHGGQGLSLYAAEERPALNEAYGLPRWLPGYLAIGDDAGGRCYALDYQGESGPAPARVVRVAYGNLDAEAAVPVAATFTDLVACFVRGALPE